MSPDVAKLDPERAALVVIDVQEAFRKAIPTSPLNIGTMTGASSSQRATMLPAERPPSICARLRAGRAASRPVLRKISVVAVINDIAVLG